MSHEIRLREVPKEFMAKVQKIAVALGAKTTTQAIEKLVSRFESDQDTIKQLTRRNSELHAAINKYYDKEDTMLRHVKGASRLTSEAATMMNNYTRQIKAMEKNFGKKKGGKR